MNDTFFLCHHDDFRILFLFYFFLFKFVLFYSLFPPYETIPQFNVNSPIWEETFNLLDLSKSEVRVNCEI